MSRAPARAAPPPPPTENGDGASASESSGAHTARRTAPASASHLRHPLTADERLLAAAKTDNEDLLESAFDQLTSVNHQDG
jgi:hypothetical protein